MSNTPQQSLEEQLKDPEIGLDRYQRSEVLALANAQTVAALERLKHTMDEHGYDLIGVDDIDNEIKRIKEGER